jgi:hypothetical protein
MSNDIKAAATRLQQLMTSGSRAVIVDGTHQNKKHILVLGMLMSQTQGSRILFRVNSLQDASDLLGVSKAPAPGTPLKADGHRLYVDSANSQSWQHSPAQVDYGVIYPLDSLDADSAAASIQDLFGRGAKQLFLVTWTDNFDRSWADIYSPGVVTYDVEDEDPAYHQRVIECIGATSQGPRLKLPKYAQSEDARYLVKLFCHSCKMSRWARLNKPYPGKIVLHKAQFGEHVATCLVCGRVANDNNNWYGQG